MVYENPTASDQGHYRLEGKNLVFTPTREKTSARKKARSMTHSPKVDSKGYTSSSKLAIQGASHGGLLVGACMTQRPDLFAAALPSVGVVEMLRFHCFTIGWGWKSDFGSSENADEFEAFLAYSPPCII